VPCDRPAKYHGIDHHRAAIASESWPLQHMRSAYTTPAKAAENRLSCIKPKSADETMSAAQLNVLKSACSKRWK